MSICVRSLSRSGFQQRRGLVDLFEKEYHRKREVAQPLSGMAVSYSQEGKFVDYYMRDDVEKFFKLPEEDDTFDVEALPLPVEMVTEMWNYTAWHTCFSGTLEKKEEEGRRTEFMQFLFERLGERYKFITRRNVSMRSRYCWGTASATLSYPRGNFCVVKFVSDFEKWDTTEGLGQYPKLWPKPHQSAFLYLDMAAAENYRIGMGPTRWGVISDGISWQIIEQVPSKTGGWDGHQTFRYGTPFKLPLPLTLEGYASLCGWLNFLFQNHAPIDAGKLAPKWMKARKESSESPTERRERIVADLAGLGDI